MPLIRKIISVGKTSKAVIIPKSWLRYYETLQGHEIKTVALEVNQIIKIRPILRRRLGVEEDAEEILKELIAEKGGIKT